MINEANIPDQRKRPTSSRKARSDVMQFADILIDCNDKSVLLDALFMERAPFISRLSRARGWAHVLSGVSIIVNNYSILYFLSILS